MEPEQGPPERCKPPADTLAACVAAARHHPRYRCDLRHNIALLEFLEVQDLCAILEGCNIDRPPYLVAGEVRSRIHGYLQHYEAKDTKWLQTEAQSAAPAATQRPTQSGNSSSVPKDVVMDTSPQKTLAQAVQALKAASAALAAAAQVLSLLGQVEHPTSVPVADTVRHLESAAVAVSGACSDLQHSSSAQPTPVRRSLSYAQAAQSGQPLAPSARSKRSSKARKAVRDCIVAAKAAVRNDRCSIKLKPVHPQGAIDFGTLARSVVAMLQRFAGPTAGRRDHKSLITDVRMDSRGQYYVQFSAEDAETLSGVLLDMRDMNDEITLPNLGKFRIRGPSVAATVGMLPVVVTGIPAHVPINEVRTEIWSANHARWGAAEEDCDKHLAGLLRLQMRNPDEQSAAIEKYVDSRSIKMFVSREVMQRLRSGHGMVRFEYSFLLVRPFEQTQRFCSRCRTMGNHTAATCRRLAHRPSD